jgi:hypothetical protein
MLSLSLRRGAALILACVTTALWLTLPICALPRDTAQETVVPYAGEETLREGSPVTESGESKPTEQDPMHAWEQTPIRGGKWIAIGLCALTAVSLLLIIAAMIPHKRK